MAEIILFEHINFEGAHRYLFVSDDDLGSAYDNFNDITSSFVVVSGEWQFSEMLIIAGLIPLYLGLVSTTGWKMLEFRTIQSLP
jgi:hypothetical protein